MEECLRPMEMFDLIVIGGGPAGYLAASGAGHARLKTAVVERRALGGVCLNGAAFPQGVPQLRQGL